LKWIDEHVDGKPYGVDFCPRHSKARAKKTNAEAAAGIPQQYKDFARSVLSSHGIDVSDRRTNASSVGRKSGATSGIRARRTCRHRVEPSIAHRQCARNASMLERARARAFPSPRW
jgi:hypothetical protein